MRRTQVDGVPVLWADGPPPFTAGLVFGVGRRDETFPQGGLTHIVEHLIMGSLGRSTLETNASVDLYTTEFTASGSPERVVEFLRRVCEALATQPVERLTTERDVLRVEGGRVQPPAVGALLSEQYGASGVGLAGFREPAISALTEHDVASWMRSWFVARNAAVWLSGPPPEGLTLPLRSGPSPVRPPQRRRELPLPALVEIPIEETVAIGAELERTPGLATALSVLQARVEDDLRHQRGLTYSVQTDRIFIDDRRRFAVITADVRAGQEGAAARALWRALRALAESGPDAAELSHQREVVEEYLADPRSLVEEARATASALVAGHDVLSRDELAQETRSVTPEQVRAAAEQLRSHALVGLPSGVDVSLPGVVPLEPPSGDPVEGRRFRRRRLQGVPPGAELRVADDGVSVVLGPDEHLTARYDQLVGMVQIGPDDEWSLLNIDGTSVPLAASDWRDGKDALAAVRAAVPAQLQVVGDEAASDGRAVLLAHAPEHRVADALWPSRRDAWVFRQGPWSLIWRDGTVTSAVEDAAGMSAAIGRHGAVVMLLLEHGELSMTVFRRGKVIDRHLWTGDEHDPATLADLLDADADVVGRLLAHPGAPAEVLAGLSEDLQVPSATAAVLAGAHPADAGLRHERARGVRESMGAAMRGEFDAPDDDGVSARLLRWNRERPPLYRAVQGVLGLGQLGVASYLAEQADGDWRSWSGGLAAFFAVGALTSFWDLRPPRRATSRTD